MTEGKRERTRREREEGGKRMFVELELGRARTRRTRLFFFHLLTRKGEKKKTYMGINERVT